MIREHLTEEQKLELKRQFEEEQAAMAAFSRWEHQAAFMRYLKREAHHNQSAFDAAFSDSRFSADVSHGAAVVSGMQNLVNIIIINIEQAKLCQNQQPHHRRRRRQPHQPQA